MTTPQAEAETGAGGTQAVALQLSELVLKTARYEEMAAFYAHVLGHGPFYPRHVRGGGGLHVRLRTWVDDELRQDARTSQLIHPVPAFVSCLSRQTTLEPGDVISTGTPAGVGHEQGLFLRSGTQVRIEIEGIGSLPNTCA
ncbi:fumarylacetoacetate hydrolase family protein [Streptomyces sp. NPDC048253]|uniref:fumarylacetoacetate hydrolase family protein n=1 Tax=Streptomyces sp. NPDC048253 TaxID=3365524 RepID=UPI00371C1995